MANQAIRNEFSHRSFTVATIGLEAKDQVTLNRIFAMTRHRSRAYNLVCVNTTDGIDRAQQLCFDADIFVINIHNPHAVVMWSRLSARSQKAKNPVIRINRSREGQKNPDLTIQWPINPARVLRTFDNYTVKYLNFIPEIEIGEQRPEQTTAPQIHRQTAQSEAPPQSRYKQRVLVADDSLTVRRQMASEMESLGMDIHLAEDGQSAKNQLDSQSYDLVFLDVVMPFLDGYNVCKSLRRSPRNRNTPVVLLTSKSSRFDKIKGRLSGCDTYLTKPINHNQLCAVITEHLQTQKEGHYER